MAMNTKEHEDLETWARTFGGTAILGFISTLLLSGKLLHHVLSMRGKNYLLSIVCILYQCIHDNHLIYK